MRIAITANQARLAERAIGRAQAAVAEAESARRAADLAEAHARDLVQAQAEILDCLRVDGGGGKPAADRIGVERDDAGQCWLVIPEAPAPGGAAGVVPFGAGPVPPGDVLGALAGVPVAPAGR